MCSSTIRCHSSAHFPEIDTGKKHTVRLIRIYIVVSRVSDRAYFLTFGKPYDVESLPAFQQLQSTLEFLNVHEQRCLTPCSMVHLPHMLLLNVCNVPEGRLSDTLTVT